MRLKFKTKNTLAFGQDWVELDLSQPGLNLIVGKHLSSSSKTSNGVGKSSLLEVALWGIYGSKPKGRLKSDIVNDETGSDSVTIVEIEQNGKLGEIVRTIDAEEFEMYGVPIVGDELAFFIDGEDMRGATMSATQELITSFVGQDEESFKASAWFTADKESFADKTPSQQDKLFLKLLRLSVLKQAREVVKKRLDAVAEEIQNCEIQTKSKHSAIEEVEASIKQAEQEIKTWKRRQKTRIAAAQEEVQRATVNLSRKQQDRENIASKVEQIQTKVDEFETPDKEEIEKLEAEKQEFQTQLDELSQDLGKIKGAVSTYRKALKSAQSLNPDARCPKCGQQLTEEHLYDYRKELNENISAEESNQADLEAEIVEIRTEIQKRSDLVSQMRSKQTEFKSLQHDLDMKQSRLNSLDSEVVTAEKRVKEKQASLEQLKSEEPPQQASTESYETRKQELLAELEKVAEEKMKLLYQQEDLEFWKQGFGPEGIRNLLIRSAIPELDRNASRFSKVLTNGELSIRFSGTKETSSGETRNKLNVKAQDLYGSDKYAKSSGGERRRIDMCVDLALHFLVAQRVALPFLFVDELFTKLDSAGKTKVMDLLRMVNEEIPSIFVISNQDDVVTEQFDNVITVCRRGKQSWIEKE